MQRMRNNNLDIRIAVSSCRPQQINELMNEWINKQMFFSL